MTSDVISGNRLFTRRNLILRLLLPMMLVSILAACGTATPSSTDKPEVKSDSVASESVAQDTVTVEILYLDHSPVRSVLSELEAAVTRVEDRVSLRMYKAGDADGEAFAEAHDITEHTPLAIFIDGSMEHKLDGRSVRFYSFPQGQGTGVVQDGDWAMADFDAILTQLAGNLP
jgi:hypothetical protein